MVDNSEIFRELAELEREIARCGRCGFCQSVCPVYHVSALEGSVARGRAMFAKQLLSGRLGLSRENEALFSECLLCRACVDICFSGVKTEEIVVAGRRARARIRGISPVYKYVFEQLLPDHRKLGRLVRLARVGGPAAAPIISALKIFGWFGARVERAQRFWREIPDKFLRERLTARRAHGADAKRAALFIGCGTNFMFPHVGESTIAVLESFGYAVEIVEHGCCGLPAYAHGALDSVKRLAKANIDRFSRSDALIVTDCSSCASFLKDYPRILSLGEPAHENEISRAQGFSSRVRDITELLGEGKYAKGTGDANESAPRVSFHEPCHLSRGQGLGQKAREALRSFPGIEYVEMKEADWCCGGAGAFALEHPDLSLKILERKINNFRRAGADVLCATCPSCLMQLRDGVRRIAPDAVPASRVMHLVEIADAHSNR